MEYAGFGGSMEFKLVEIVNQSPIEPSADALASDPKAAPLDVNGAKGQTLAWIEDQRKYIVETFEGDLVAIAEENLKEYQPPLPAEGGFNVAFPGSEGMAESFQAELAELLLAQKYCVVQMSLKQSDRKASARGVQDLDKWARFMPEFENTYMGQRPDGKKVQWYVESGYEEQDTDVGIGAADQHLSNLAIAVGNICPYLGFNGVCRSNGMLHANCASASEEQQLLEEARGNAVGAGVIQGHLTFFHRRKICMLYFINGSGGTLTLHPVNPGEEDITLSCREGQAIVFRHDVCDYTYIPEGKQLALQAWVFREQHAGEVALAQPALLAFENEIEKIPHGPNYGNNGKSVDVMSLASRIPGIIQSPDNYWTGLCVGFDGVIKIPLGRWDHDTYYVHGAENMPGIGKAYTCHNGLLDNDTQMFCFDNSFFGIPEEDVQKIDPPARCILEVGYDSLYRAGWTRQKLLGVEMVCCYGCANNEFEAHQMNGWRMEIQNDTRTLLNLGCTASRLQFTFGMVGRCATVETACSSSLTAIGLMHSHMRPDQTGQMKLGSAGKQTQYGLGMGANGHFDPMFMIGLCGAKMLSIQGRCFTFDQSGDGFVRGEGCAAMYFKVSDGEDLARLAMMCGSCLNQDGRSASLTAPHGPSQQECIRHSLREAGIPPLLIQMQELHGTGTALGDPIEVGALRATMMMNADYDVREHPLVKTSSKSNIGHTELCAGICGIMKCVLMGIYCTACPNNHIRLLNPHIDSAAYPVYFCTEAVDQGKNEGYLGVSSFGFGGSNARGDIWARCLCGPRNTDPGESRPQLNADRIFIWGEICRQSLPTVKLAPQMANALDSLEGYTDAYLTGETPADDDNFYCVGSFNGWTQPEKMTYQKGSGCYVFGLPLGETCVEQFQICMNKNEYFKIFPGCKMAGQDALVLGPGMAPPGNVWVVDGRAQSLPQGTVYQIILQWDVETRKKSVSWEPTVDEDITELAAELEPFRHRYHIISTWSLWKPLELKPAKDGPPGTFETTVKMSFARREEFRFLRDGDKMQAIYPSRKQTKESDSMPMVWTEAGIAAMEAESEKLGRPKAGDVFTQAQLSVVREKDGMGHLSEEELTSMGYVASGGMQSVPICGPDHLGEEKFWSCDGAMGESVRITLRVWNGEITVSTASTKKGLQTWTSQQAVLRRKYYVTAAWNNWGFTPMQPRADRAGVHHLKVQLPKTQLVAFQIVVDEDKAQTIHPEMALTDQLLSPALGPDAKGLGLYWGFYADRGSNVDIKLDLFQDDRRKVVTWTVKK